MDEKKTTNVAQFTLGEPDMRRILSGFAVREEILGLLCRTTPVSDAIGVCAAFLALAGEVYPDQVRVALDSTVTAQDGRQHRVRSLLRL